MAVRISYAANGGKDKNCRIHRKNAASDKKTTEFFPDVFALVFGVGMGQVRNHSSIFVSGRESSA